MYLKQFAAGNDSVEDTNMGQRKPPIDNGTFLPNQEQTARWFGTAPKPANTQNLDSAIEDANMGPHKPPMDKDNFIPNPEQTARWFGTAPKPANTKNLATTPKSESNTGEVSHNQFLFNKKAPVESPERRELAYSREASLLEERPHGITVSLGKFKLVDKEDVLIPNIFDIQLDKPKIKPNLLNRIFNWFTGK